MGSCAHMLVSLVSSTPQAQKGQEPYCRVGSSGGPLGSRGFSGGSVPVTLEGPLSVSPFSSSAWSSGASVLSPERVYKLRGLIQTCLWRLTFL